MAYYHIYKNNPTAGGTDGTQVSESTGLNPISVTLNATNNEESIPIKLAIRCETGHQTVGDCVISITGTTSLKWALSLDNVTWNTYGSSLTISSTINNTNIIFYSKAKASSDEIPNNDNSVDFQISATIGVV